MISGGFFYAPERSRTSTDLAVHKALNLVATFGGKLHAGYSMTGGEPSDTEAIFVRIDAGEETAAISLDREVFEGGIAHEDGAVTLQLGGVEFVIARRE